MSRITKKAPYGQHITLTCKNHPDKFWSTKNIDSIGCRTIFYNLRGDPKMGAECSCSWRDLIPVEIDGPDVPE